MTNKIVLVAGISLDGFIEGKDRDISWHRVDDEVHGHFNEYLATMGGFVSGRVTHELMAEFWPTADEDPTLSPTMAEFAGIWRDMPKFVFSSTLTDPGWNTTVFREVTAEAVDEIKATVDGDLSLSGANLTRSFQRLDLIDAYHLHVHPVLIGSGTPLFSTPDTSADLRLVGTRTFGNGVVLLDYER